MSSHDEQKHLFFREALEILPAIPDSMDYEPGGVVYFGRNRLGKVVLYTTDRYDFQKNLRSLLITHKLAGMQCFVNKSRDYNAEIGASVMTVGADIGIKWLKASGDMARYEGVKRIRLPLSRPEIQSLFYQEVSKSPDLWQNIWGDQIDEGLPAEDQTTVVFAVVTTTYTVENATYWKKTKQASRVGLEGDGGPVRSLSSLAKVSAPFSWRKNLFMFQRSTGVAGLVFYLFRAKFLREGPGKSALALSAALTYRPFSDKNISNTLTRLNNDGGNIRYVPFGEIDRTENPRWGMLLKMDGLKDNKAFCEKVEEIQNRHFPNPTGEEKAKRALRKLKIWMFVFGFISGLIIIGLSCWVYKNKAEMSEIEEKMRANEAEMSEIEEKMRANEAEMSEMCHPRFKIGKFAWSCRFINNNDNQRSKTLPKKLTPVVEAMTSSKTVHRRHDNRIRAAFAPQTVCTGWDGGFDVKDFATPAILFSLFLMVLLALLWGDIFSVTGDVFSCIFHHLIPYWAWKSTQPDVAWTNSIQEQLDADGFVPIIHSPEVLCNDSIDPYIRHTIFAADGTVEPTPFDARKALEKFIESSGLPAAGHAGDAEGAYFGCQGSSGDRPSVGKAATNAEGGDSPGSKGSSTDSNVTDDNPASPARTLGDR